MDDSTDLIFRTVLDDLVETLGGTLLEVVVAAPLSTLKAEIRWRRNAGRMGGYDSGAGIEGHEGDDGTDRLRLERGSSRRRWRWGSISRDRG